MRKPAAKKKAELEPIPLAEVEAEADPLAMPDELFVPDAVDIVPDGSAAPEAAAEGDGMPDFSFADPGKDSPVQSGGDDDLQDFFQDLDRK